MTKILTSLLDNIRYSFLNFSIFFLINKFFLAEPKPGEICKTHEFLCRNQQQCVLKGFVCDGEYDCLDQSDEIGCGKKKNNFEFLSII